MNMVASSVQKYVHRVKIALSALVVAKDLYCKAHGVISVLTMIAMEVLEALLVFVFKAIVNHLVVMGLGQELRLETMEM